MATKKNVARSACLLRFYLVGTGGLEPPTPTVSKKNIKINQTGFLPSLIDLLRL